MLRILTRRSNDPTYFTNDLAKELDGLRDGDPGWWLRGSGDTRDPDVVRHVFTTTNRSQLAGYDLVFAAPRPISTLLAVDPEHAHAVVDAHRESVRAAVSYLEDRAVTVRDQRGGEQLNRSAQWESVVSFTHGLNRHGEPHLHDHVLVGARPEDSSKVLDSRALFAHARTADALYRASLRHEISERTPWSTWRSFEGVEHVANLDEGYRALWGGHHATKGEKLRWSRDETTNAWKKDLTRFESLGVLDAPQRNEQTLDEHRFAGALEGLSSVSRRHVVEAWANAVSYGQRPDRITTSIDALYPYLRAGSGVHEHATGVLQVRKTREVRTLGARPLEGPALEKWNQRSLSIVRSTVDRSRSR